MQYTLKKPIVRKSGDTLTVITMSEAPQTVADWLWIEANIKANNAFERQVMAICRFGGLFREEVAQLDMVDFYGLMGGGEDKAEEEAAKKEESSGS